MQHGPTDPEIQATPPEQAPAENSAIADTNPNTETATQEPADPVAFQRLMDRFASNDSLLASTLLFGGVLLMVIIMMRLAVKKTKSNRKRAHVQGSPSERLAQIHDSAQSAMAPPNKVMVEAEEMARHLGAILDNKAARLELLIEEADNKLDTLNRTLASSTPQRTTDSQPPAEQPVQQTPPARTIDPSLLDRARMEQDLAERQTRVAGRIEPTFQESPPAPTPNEPQSIQSKVIEMAFAGLTNAEIAHQLNQPIGQVELILNLRKQQS